jgi:hypothetical protein
MTCTLLTYQPCARTKCGNLLQWASPTSYRMTREKIDSDLADDVVLPSYFSDRSRRGKRGHWRIPAGVLLFASFLWWSWSHRLIAPCNRPAYLSETLVTVPGSDIPDIGFPEGVLRTWGQYSPYIPVAEYIPPPPGCIINQVSSHSVVSLPTINTACP